MRKYLMALAATALLASQAGAATITGPTTVQAGVAYTYTYQPNTPVVLIDGYTLYDMFLDIDDNNDGITEGRFFYGTTYPENNSFSFQWIFNTAGLATLSIRSILTSHIGASVVQEDGYFRIIKSTQYDMFASGWGPEEWQGGPPVTLQVSVVPIAGTMPLLLSALAGLGWVMRRRKVTAAA